MHRASATENQVFERQQDIRAISETKLSVRREFVTEWNRSAGKARSQLFGSHARFARSRADRRTRSLGIVCIGQIDLAFDHMP